MKRPRLRGEGESKIVRQKVKSGFFKGGTIYLHSGKCGETMVISSDALQSLLAKAGEAVLSYQYHPDNKQ